MYIGSVKHMVRKHVAVINKTGKKAKDPANLQFNDGRFSRMQFLTDIFFFRRLDNNILII